MPTKTKARENLTPEETRYLSFLSKARGYQQILQEGSKHQPRIDRASSLLKICKNEYLRPARISFFPEKKLTTQIEWIPLILAEEAYLIDQQDDSAALNTFKAALKQYKTHYDENVLGIKGIAQPIKTKRSEWIQENTPLTKIDEEDTSRLSFFSDSGSEKNENTSVVLAQTNT